MKKWTYLVASVSAVLTMGSVLTSCVDNDEPKGIYELRVGYAKLLDSKAALNAAQATAATTQAEAEKIKAQAEATKAEIEKIKAEAEAEYTRALAQAELLRAQAAAEVDQARAAQLLADAAVSQAQADQIKARTEMEIKERTAALEISIAQAEVTLKQLQLQYESAVLAFEKEKLNLSQAQATYINNFYTRYFAELNAYNNAYAAYLQAQRAHLEWQIDLSATNYADAKKYEKAVAQAEKALALAEDMLALANEELENLKTVQPDGIYSIISEYKDKCVNLRLERDAAWVEYVAIQAENKELYDQRDELFAAANDVADEVVTIPNYSIDAAALAGQIPNAAVASLWNETGEYPIIDEANIEYTLNNDANYVDAVDTYNSWITTFGYYILDENGQAWSEVKVNQLKAQLEYAKANVATESAQWAAAVAAFNKGQAMDYTKLPGWADYVKAIDAYNALVAKVTPLAEAIPAAVADYNAKVDALQVIVNEVFGKDAQALSDKYDADMKAANDAYNAAYTKAGDAYVAAADKAQAEFDKAVVAKREAYDKAVKASANASNKVWIALTTLGADSQEYKDADKAYQEALKKEADAEKAFNDALEAAQPVYDAAIAKANYNRANAINDANVALSEAQAKAADDYNAAVKAAGITAGVSAAEQAQYDAAAAARDKAWDAAVAAGKAYDAATASEVVDPLFIALVAKAQALIDGVGMVDYPADVYQLWNDVTDAVFYQNPLPEAVAETLSPVNPLNIKQAVADTSAALYGVFGQHILLEYFLYELWDADAYIVELDQAAINAIMKRYFAEWGQDVVEIEYPSYYPEWGSTGEVLSLETNIALYTAFQSNTEALQTVIDGLTEGLAAVQKTLEDQKAKEDEAWAAYDEVNDAINEVEAELIEKFNEIDAELALYENLINTIYWAINDVNNYSENDMVLGQIFLDPEDIALDIAVFENTIIPMLEGDVELAKEALELAQYQLAAYQRHEAEVMPWTEFQLIQAEKALEVAQQKLDIAKAALDRAIKVAEGTAE